MPQRRRQPQKTEISRVNPPPKEVLDKLPDHLRQTVVQAASFTAPILAHDSPREPDLQAALADLVSAVDEAREEKFDTLPSDGVIESARRILERMYEMHRCRFEVYPTQDGEIAISASAEQQRSVLVICDKEGGALCSVNLNGLHRRARYDSAATLPDGFVKEALAELI